MRARIWSRGVRGPVGPGPVGPVGGDASSDLVAGNWWARGPGAGKTKLVRFARQKAKNNRCASHKNRYKNFGALRTKMSFGQFL